jgi:glycosyltransferase involved in cell wall biosynthesis
VRIALVTRRYPPLIGGAEKVLSYLATALAAEGHDVTVVTSRVLEPLSEPVTPSPVPVVHLPSSRLRFVGTILYMRSLRQWLESHRPDVIYVSMLKHDAYVAVGVGRRLGIPVVLRPEGAGATGDLAWQTWGRFGATIAKRCLQADAVVSISPAVRAELISAGYDPAKIHDLPNGAPVPNEPWKPSEVQARAAFVGRLAPEKGLDTLLDAWPLVLASRPDARLTLVGDGPERSRLEAQIASLGIASSVDLAGSHPAPIELLRASDLFVLPSREEGMSVALLEAMALGLPIVATDIPGNRGLIDEGIHGHLVPPDRPAALAAAILRRWDEPGAAARMASAARRRVVSEFSIAAVARGHLEMFARLIREKSG